MTAARTGLAMIILAATLVTPTALGNVSAYFALIAALLALPVLLDKRLRDAALGNPGLKALVLAFGLIALALVFAMREVGDLVAVGDFLVLLLSIPVFAVVYALRPRFRPEHMALLCLLGVGVSAAVSLYEVGFLSRDRSTGIFSSAVFMGNIAVMLGFLSLGGAWLDIGMRRWLFILGPALAGLTAVLSGTRGSLFAALTLTLCLALVALVRNRSKVGHVALIVVGLALVLITTYFLVSRSVPLFERLTMIWDLMHSGHTADDSINFRVQYYQAGLSAFTQAPLFGHGWWRRFLAAMPYMSQALIAEGSGAKYAHVHNELLNMALGMGLVGVVAYFSMLAAPLLGIRRPLPRGEDSALTVFALVLAIGMASMGLFDVMLVFEMPKMVFCFSAAIVLALAAPLTRPRQPSGTPVNSQQFAQGET